MFPQFYHRKNQAFYKTNGEHLLAGNVTAEKKNGIFRFVPSGSYASLFGNQWKEYKKTQLDSFSGIPITTKRLDRCLGPLKDNP
jgi:hypothetical protein